MVVAVVVAFILRGLPDHCANSRPCGAADNCALQTTPEDRAEHRASGTADQRAFTRPDAALTMVIVVVVVRVAVVIVVATASAVANAIVVGAVVIVLLSNSGSHCGGQQKSEAENRSLGLFHYPLDAES